MKTHKFLFTTCFLLLPLFLFSQTLDWYKILGGNHYDRIYDLKSDNNYFYITGSTSTTLNWDALSITSSTLDFFIAKYDKNGHVKWIKNCAQDIEISSGRSIQIDSEGDVIVTGNFSKTIQFEDSILTSDDDYTDIFIAKFDSSGNFKWAHQMGGYRTDEAIKVRVDKNDNIYLLGNNYDTLTFDNGHTINNKTGVFLAKYAPDGTLEWTTNPKNKSSTVGDGLATDSKGYIYVTGMYSDSLFFENDSIYGNRNVFIACYNPNGDNIWAKDVGNDLGGYFDHGNDIYIDNDDNIFITGIMGGNNIYYGLLNLIIDNLGPESKMFVLSIDTLGNLNFFKRYPTIKSGQSITSSGTQDLAILSLVQKPLILNNDSIIKDNDYSIISIIDKQGNLKDSVFLGSGFTDWEGGIVSTNNAYYIASWMSNINSLHTGTNNYFILNSDKYFFNTSTTGSEAILLMKITIDDVSNSIKSPIANTNIELYPIPFKDFLTINAKESSIKELHVYDLNGQSVYKNKYMENTMNIILDTKSFKSNLYLVNIIDQNNSISVYKVLKQ